MVLHRAPLFSVSVAFAIGCVAGLQVDLSLRWPLLIALLGAALWLVSRARPAHSLLWFYLVVCCAGWAHTRLVRTTVSSDDLRLLADAKYLGSTQWQGVIVEEPNAQTPTHQGRGHRTMDRTGFVVEMRAWRAVGGRLFGAPIDTPWQKAQGLVRCTLIGPSESLVYGDRIEFAAALQDVPAPLSPGELNYPKWEGQQGIYYHATIPTLNWRRVETASGWDVRNFSLAARDWAYRQLQIGLEDDLRMADFLAGMLIGYRQEIPLDIEQDFRRTGTLHVFAVSGQNIAEMLVALMVLLQLFGLVRWRWAWLLAPLVLSYCLLTGSPASAIRATVMALAVLLAWRLGRPLHALGCWSLAFGGMLVCDPALLLDPGAQLSFGVVLGIILLAPPLMGVLHRHLQPDPFLPRELLSHAQTFEAGVWRWTCALVSATLAATVASEPITALDFHQITPISAFANLVVVPLAGLITTVGTMSLLLAPVSPFLTALLNNANWFFARGLILFVGWLAHSPGSSLNVPDPRVLASPAPHLLVAPLQDSACLLVRTGRGAWLVNTGREQMVRTATLRLLQYYGINRLDGVFLAQISIADNSGAPGFLTQMTTGQIFLPVLPSHSPLQTSLNSWAQEKGVTLRTAQRGDAFNLGDDTTLTVLHPSVDSRETHLQDRALVLQVRQRGVALLWAGKISAETQADLLTAWPDLRADVLVQASDEPCDPAWLHRLGARYWLQIPSRDKPANVSSPAAESPLSGLQIWPLAETGAVQIFARTTPESNITRLELRPWVSLPKAP